MKYLKETGVVASLGHTAAGYNEVEKAVFAGASNVTHTYNAQKGYHHRDIGTVGAALLIDDLNCELICDTIHVSVPAIKMVVKNNANEFAESGFCSIARAEENPSGENFILDFSYYI